MSHEMLDRSCGVWKEIKEVTEETVTFPNEHTNTIAGQRLKGNRAIDQPVNP